MGRQTESNESVFRYRMPQSEHSLFSSALLSSPSLDDLQGLGGRCDGNVLIALEDDQVVIPGDDQIGAGGERASEQRIVVRIAGDPLRELSGRHQRG